MRLFAGLLACVLLAGCSNDLFSSGDGQGYLSGDGSAKVIPVAERDEPVEVSGATIDGGAADVADLRGRVVVMPIWGSWCAPCRTEAPMLEKASQDLAARAAFLGINVRDTDKAARAAFVKDAGISYPSLDDPAANALLSLSNEIAPNSVPGVVFLDAEGRVAAVVIGEITRTTLDGLVEEVAGVVAGWFEEQVYSGSLLVALPVAAIAGLVSFFSPCVVPLLPGYVSYATGLSGADLATAKRSRMVAGTSLFVLGFTVVFLLYGALWGAAGRWLHDNARAINIVLGLLTIALGLVFMGVVPWLQRDLRIHAVPSVGLAAAPFLGVLFAVGWTPCLGPTLTAVQALSFNEGTEGRGVLLSLGYALGLGVPFILAGVAFERTLGLVGWVRRHQLWVMRVGGTMLVTVGLLLVTGLWAEWVARLQSWVLSSGTAL